MSGRCYLLAVIRENLIAKETVDSIIKVHRDLGPGLLESVNKTALAHELSRRSLEARRHPYPLPSMGRNSRTVFALTLSWKAACSLKSSL